MLVSLRLLIGAPHMNVYKLFIFLTPTIWCSNLFVLEHTGEMQDLDWITPGVNTWETLFKQCLFSVISCAGWAVLMQFCETLCVYKTFLLIYRKVRGETINTNGPKCAGEISEATAHGLQWMGQQSTKLKGFWKNGVLIFFEMPQLIAMRCPQCMDD